MADTPQDQLLDPSLGWIEPGGDFQSHTILNPLLPSQFAGASPDRDDPSSPDELYQQMFRRWMVILANLEGIRYLKANAKVYLPQFPKEKDPHYRGRVARSVYTPYLERLVRGAVGLILRKPIHFSGGDEEYWAEWRLNVDRCDTSLDDFVRATLFMSIAYGHSSILADNNGEPRQNLLEQRVAGDAPFLVQVPPWATIGRRHDARNGDGLTMVRIREVEEVSEGMFGSRLIEQIRVLTPGAYEVWQRSSETSEVGGWSKVNDLSGTMDIEGIPLATTYSHKDGVLLSRPPLEKCAELNIAHYQRRSDLTQILTIAGQPILDLMGYDADDDTIGLSVNNAIQFPIGGGSKYTEISGSSCTAMQEELQSLADQITQLGISTLAQQQGFQEAAEAKGLDRAESNSMLSIIAKDLEKTLQTVMNWCGEYAGRKPPTVSLDADFDRAKLTPEEAGKYLEAFVAGAIDHESFVEAWQQGEWLPSEVTPEEVVSAAEAEAAERAERAMNEAISLKTAGEPTGDAAAAG